MWRFLFRTKATLLVDVHVVNIEALWSADAPEVLCVGLQPKSSGEDTNQPLSAKVDLDGG